MFLQKNHPKVRAKQNEMSLHTEDAFQIAVYRVEALGCICARPPSNLFLSCYSAQACTTKRCLTIIIMRSYPCYAALGHLTFMLLLTGVPKLGFCYSYFFG